MYQRDVQMPQVEYSRVWANKPNIWEISGVVVFVPESEEEFMNNSSGSYMIYNVRTYGIIFMSGYGRSVPYQDTRLSRDLSKL